jgi:hypothetical protein
LDSQIVVVTAVDDKHLDLVVPLLERSGAEVIVLDPRTIPETGKGISYELASECNRVWYGDVLLDQVVSVWKRKPLPVPAEMLPVPRKWRAYAAETLATHTNSLWQSWPLAMWVSKMAAIKAANCKPYQLPLAQRLGLSVPRRTLQTSHPSQGRAFVKELWRRDGMCVYKSLSAEALRDPENPDELLMPWTTNLYPSEEGYPFEGLRATPGIFQEYVKGDDIRVVVVGRKVFSAEMVHEGIDEDNNPDWRPGILAGTLKILPHELPEGVANALVAMVRELDLAMGVFDLRRTLEGEYVFLEINPNGQWGDVEIALQAGIGLAVAELLLSPLTG